MYQCVLVDKNGYRQECLFREAESALECLKELQTLQYSEGNWTIYDNDEEVVSGSS